MAFLFRCDDLSKSFGSRDLFKGISISFEDGERTGLIGPNGSGKSTLLKILAGLETPDAGTLTIRRNIKLGYVPQEDLFPAGATVQSVLAAAMVDSHLDEHDRDVRAAILLDKIGFTEGDAVAESLSGGWRKRLSIARQLIAEPDVLLLDEPTNHLDLDGIDWLEKLLNGANFAYLLVSHDRTFLDRTTKRTIELSPAYADGYLSMPGPYSQFVGKREEYLTAQASLETSVAGKVRRELEWLSRGAKARTTKAKGRIEQAAALVDELATLRRRNNTGQQTKMDFVGTDRQTRKLLTFDKVAKSLGGRQLFKDVGFTLGPGDKLGLVGPNGSGKTTLIKLMTGQLEADAGTVKRADGLKVVVFDQTRAALDQNQTLKNALAPGSESVVFRGDTIHISSWANQFLFTTQQLDMPVRDLSGGEQSRVLVARLMLQPADVLILDEPTNDLDIPSLEILESTLADFPGGLVLVTHDRYMLDRLSTELIGLDGRGSARPYVNRAQYDRDRISSPDSPAASKPKPKPVGEKPKPKKLSYLEQREYEQIEARIHDAEAVLAATQQRLGDPAVMADRSKMTAAATAAGDAQTVVEKLYARWQELEEKRG